MNISFKINTGAEQYDPPSIEDCLKDGTGKFHSTQNALRLYEWLRGTETTPLVLEAKIADKDGTFELRQFGKLNVAAYPEVGWKSGRILKLEQIVAAVPSIKAIMNRNVEEITTNSVNEARAVFIGNTTAELMKKFNELWAFNASAMFFAHEIPRRFHFTTLETLDILCTCVLTQRNKQVHQPNDDYPHEIPLEMYSTADLDVVITRLQQSVMEGFFPNPEEQAERDHLLGGWFFKNCAMAWSEVTGIPIPVDYFNTQFSTKYYWAKKVLQQMKDELPSLEVEPKSQNVVNISFKK